MELFQEFCMMQESFVGIFDVRSLHLLCFPKNLPANFNETKNFHVCSTRDADGAHNFLVRAAPIVFFIGSTVELNMTQ